MSIVYGFGDNWEYTSETKMKETENSFEALITLKNYNTFNFCFKNNYNVWDNNSGFNYIASISPAEEKNNIQEITKENNEIEQKEVLQSVDIEINTAPTNENLETSVSTSGAIENISEIDQAFDSLLESILEIAPEQNVNVNLENGFGLQSVDEITETDLVNSTISNELAKINTPEKDIVENVAGANSELENLLSSITEKQETTSTGNFMSADELDNLMNDVLNSILEEEAKEANIQKADSSEKVTLGDKFLPVVQDDEDFFDKCIDASYNLCRKVWMGIKKFGILMKKMAQDLLSEKQ